MSGLVDKTLSEIEKDRIKIGKSFKTVLSDFNVMPYLIGMVIALSFNKLLNQTVKSIGSIFFKKPNALGEAFIEFILTILLISIFIHQIYYKYLVDDEIDKEKIVKTALNEAKVEEARKEIEDDPVIQKHIEKEIEL